MPPGRRSGSVMSPQRGNSAARVEYTPGKPGLPSESGPVPKWPGDALELPGGTASLRQGSGINEEEPFYGHNSKYYYN